jgi:hypothetical protein
VGEGFSVSAAELQAGSQDVGTLLDRCLIITEDAVHALAGMAGSVGHAGLAPALGGAAAQGARTFWAMGAAYQHIGDGLAASAETYAGTEHGIAGQFGAIFGKLR